MGDDPSDHPSLYMEDVGTRQQHLIDLYDYWTLGVDVLTERAYTPRDKRILKELETARERLWVHLTGNYNAEIYRRTINYDLPTITGDNGDIT